MPCSLTADMRPLQIGQRPQGRALCDAEAGPPALELIVPEKMMRVAVIRDYDKGIAVEEYPSANRLATRLSSRFTARVCAIPTCISSSWRNRPLPLVLGHEVAGIAPGMGPVLVHQSWGCGHCPACQRGEEQLCTTIKEAGFERHGGYAEKIIVPHKRYLIPLGDLDLGRGAADDGWRRRRTRRPPGAAGNGSTGRNAAPWCSASAASANSRCSSCG